jgi:hypothetical protein
MSFQTLNAMQQVQLYKQGFGQGAVFYLVVLSIAKITVSMTDE